MFVSRSLSRLSGCLLSVLLFAGCQKSDPPPAKTVSRQLTTGRWRLDELRRDGQLVHSGAAIPDRYQLTFRPDGTFSLQYLPINSTITFDGNWSLKANDTVLNLTDNRVTNQDYLLLKLTANELRYRLRSPNSFDEQERVFSAQP